MKCSKCHAAVRMHGVELYTDTQEIVRGHTCWCCGHWVETLPTPKPERKPEPVKKTVEAKPEKPEYAPCPTGCGGIIRPSQNEVGVCTGCYQHVQNFLRSKTLLAKLEVPVEHLKGKLLERVEAKLREREGKAS